MDRLGVYGGTFDPVHCGHLAVARSVREAFDLSHMLFIPARQSPLRAPPLASAHDRLEMLRRAIDRTPGFEVSPIDSERPGPSYMIDTLRILAAERPAAQLFLILGADALGELPAWRQAGRILTAAQIIVVPRPGHSTQIPPEVRALHPNAERRIRSPHAAGGYRRVANPCCLCRRSTNRRCGAAGRGRVHFRSPVVRRRRDRTAGGDMIQPPALIPVCL